MTPEEYITLFSMLSFVLSQIVPFLPVTVTSKIPDVIMQIINLLAGKHNADKVAETDIKGNPITK